MVATAAERTSLAISLAKKNTLANSRKNFRQMRFLYVPGHRHQQSCLEPLDRQPYTYTVYVCKFTGGNLQIQHN